PYIKKMLEKYRMLLAKPVSQPCPQTHRLSKDQSPQTQEERERMNRLPYREGVGSVTYEACALRPDCAFAVKECAMHNNDPGEWHWKALMHLMRYLKDTMDARLVYKRSGTDEIRLTCYADSSLGDNEDGTSTGGYLTFLNDCLVSWSCKKQTYITGSTMVAEYVAL
ncbi:unnamed protein product, partial [Vitrella brassicaformis CCMP3155]